MSEKPQQFGDSVQRFLETLRKSELIPESEIDFAVNEFSQRVETVPLDVDFLLHHLVQRGLLTSWQGDKLAKGRYKGFFLGKYKLLDHLGTGGMSTVYLAEQRLTSQKRAIKVLPRNRTQERSYLARFYREGKAIAALNDPNIVRIYDIARQGDTHYMVMEYVHGQDLYDMVDANGPLNFSLAADCIRQAAQGLSHAHGKQLIHRDIKPANLFRTQAGVIKVLDLGLALLKSDNDEHGLSRQYNERTMGTADYLAPEQAIDSHNVDHRVDIYALGCTLFYLLTGRPPFDEGTLAQRIAAHQTKEPPALRDRRPDCPEFLEAICQRMMQKHPDDRFPNCSEVIAAIDTEDVGSHPFRIHRNAKKSTLPDNQEHPPPATRHERHTTGRKVPLTTAILLASLALIATGLAIVVIGSRTGETAVGRRERNERSVSTGLNPTANEASGRIAQNGSGPTTNPPGPPLVSSPATSTDLSVLIDFETTSRLRDRGNSWDLISNRVIAGTLLHDRKAHLTDCPARGRPPSGGKCLLLRGDCDDVEFRPSHPQARIGFVKFLARRQSGSLPVKLNIEAKSRKRFERWQVIAEFGDEIDGIEFSPIEIDSHQFSKADSRKFRFKIEGDAESGIYIDDLEIQLR